MINIKNLKKSFGDNEVLRDISFEIEKGIIYGLVGKNGAGKTTLLNIIAGLSDLSDGECMIAGETVKKGKTMACNIGYLPDIPAFSDVLTVGEYLGFLMKDADKSEIVTRKKELLGIVKLSEKVVIKTMSRGMKQRLGIAATLVNNPDVILLDEPTSALDPVGRNELMNILKHLKEEGKTIILSTHILADMEKVCDKVGFLQDGIIKKEVVINELDTSTNALRVVFESEPVLPLYEEEMLQITKVNEKEYIFNIGNIIQQKYLFEYLSKIDTPIVGIRRVLQSLDEMFQEMCH